MTESTEIKVYNRIEDALENYWDCIFSFYDYYFAHQDALKARREFNIYYGDLDMENFFKGSHCEELKEIDIDKIKQEQIEAILYNIKCVAWEGVLGDTRIKEIYDREAVEAFIKQNANGEAPDFTKENIQETIKLNLGNAHFFFLRGIANAFSNLDPRFKSHSPFKINKRFIFNNLISKTWGKVEDHYKNTIIDVDRILESLSDEPPKKRYRISEKDGKEYETSMGEMELAIHNADTGSFSEGIKPTVIETENMRIKTYKNGNAHFWFKSQDTMDKVNRYLHEYYGEVLPDAYTVKETTGEVRSRDVSTKLAFYPTPPEVMQIILNSNCVSKLSQGDKKILEPSAGDGAMVDAIVAKYPNNKIHAVEIHPDRYNLLKAKSKNYMGVTTQNENFLSMQAICSYDFVIMNPPFSGTHWIDHIYHAWNFIKPGGTLIAVLPVTAKVGESNQHQKFHRWLMEQSDRDLDSINWLLTDLPPLSFKDTGTNINTIYLHIDKKRA